MIIYITVFMIVVLNFLVTSHVIRDDQRRGYEKLAESGLIWIVPVIGALVSLCITIQGPAKIREYEDVRKFFTYAH